MEISDLPGALRLSTAVGWNQIAADWHRMLQLEPRGCFVAESYGDVVGTTICCTFGPVAWLAMVIVREDQRGRGLGRELVQAGLQYAQQSGATTVRLDATRLGEAVYRKLGFQPQFELIRMGGLVKSDRTVELPAGRIQPATEEQYAEIIRMDREATRTDRGKLLQQLFTEWTPLVALSPSGIIEGFLASREGRLSRQYGPMSGCETSAVDLLKTVLNRSAGQAVIADIPVTRASLLEVAREFGLTEQRTLLRMNLGITLEESKTNFHLSYGGEFG